MLFRKAIGNGVRSGLEKAFAPGGPASTAFGKALDKGLAPLKAEIERLRRVERRYRWHPIDKAPAWVMDGRPILVSQDGDQFWACWQEGDDHSPPYWDRDIEYGGSACDPDHFFPIPAPPRPPALSSVSEGQSACAASDAALRPEDRLEEKTP